MMYWQTCRLGERHRGQGALSAAGAWRQRWPRRRCTERLLVALGDWEGAMEAAAEVLQGIAADLGALTITGPPPTMARATTSSRM